MTFDFYLTSYYFDRTSPLSLKNPLTLSYFYSNKNHVANNKSKGKK